MASVHCLDDYCPNLSVDGQLIERVETTRLLGTDIHQNLNWKNDSESKITSCYSTISVLKKLKHLAPFQLRKQLAESLILTKIDYNDVVTYSANERLLKRLQKVQSAVAGFVLNRFASTKDVRKLGWLPIHERRQFNLLKLAHKTSHNLHWPTQLNLEQYVPAGTLRRQFNLLKLAHKTSHNPHWPTQLNLEQYVPARTLRRQFNLLKLAHKTSHNPHWPTQLNLEQYVPARTLRSGSTFNVHCNFAPTSFRHSAATIFNSLPANIRESHHFSDFL